MENAGLFQSPRSGKFVSNPVLVVDGTYRLSSFQSPRSGKFVSDF